MENNTNQPLIKLISGQTIFIEDTLKMINFLAKKINGTQKNIPGIDDGKRDTRITDKRTN